MSPSVWKAVAERAWAGAQVQLRVGVEATVEAAPWLAAGQDAASAEAGQVESDEVVMGAASEVLLRRAGDVRQARPDRPGTCQSGNAAQGGPGVVSRGDGAPEVAGRTEVGHPELSHVRCHAAAATDQADPRTNPPPTAILRSPDVPGHDDKIGPRGRSVNDAGPAKNESLVRVPSRCSRGSRRMRDLRADVTDERPERSADLRCAGWGHPDLRSPGSDSLNSGSGRPGVPAGRSSASGLNNGFPSGFRRL